MLQIASVLQSRYGVEFQWAPTLGGECYCVAHSLRFLLLRAGFNGHPPLGVNATDKMRNLIIEFAKFQWAPTLGGECYWFMLNLAGWVT